MKSRKIVLASLLVMLTMACSLTSKTPVITLTQEPVPVGKTTPDPVPVTINDGLTSLNSYDMTVIFKSTGPDPEQSSTTTIHRLRSNDSNASSTSLNVTGISAGGGEPNTTDTTIYQIGNDQCSGSDADEWSWSSSTPAEAEMQGLIVSMIGLTPLIDNPDFVSEETVNGIPTNHFEFHVSGLGASSGSVVNINQGDYWLAVDGQYIVKYILIVETSQAADTQVLHEEVTIELNQINQPVNIVFPQGCLDASQVTPEP